MAYSLRDNLAYVGNFTSGRQGSRINKIIIHHAATTDFDGIARTFQTPGRQTSAHYGVGRNNNVDRYVAESNIAWHAGNWEANTTSIGIENVNKTGGPNWEIDETTFNTLVELVRDIAQRNGLLPLKRGVNLFGHRDFSQTACPGQLYARLDELVSRVNNGQSSGGAKPAPAPSSSKKSNEQVATEVMNGSWGNNPQRSINLKNAGYDPNTIQAIVNSRYGIGSAPAPQPQSLTTVAQQVIAGAFGNNPGRADNLRRAGYDPSAVQAEVNRLLGVGTSAPAPAASSAITAGSNVVVTLPVDYNGVRLGTSGTYTVMEIKGDRAVIGRGGAVTAAINIHNIRKV